MTALPDHDKRLIMMCLALSLLVHLVCSAPLDLLKPFTLGTPVLQNQPIFVELQAAAAAVPTKQSGPEPTGASPFTDSTPVEESQPAAPEAESAAAKADPETAPVSLRQLTDPSPPGTILPAPAPPLVPVEAALGHSEGQSGNLSAAGPKNTPYVAALPPLRRVEEFLATDWELLTYRISMLGIPVGTAELEAKQENGEVRISLRIQSNEAISQLYPVDDSVETRQIGGNFIVSRIRQREGSFRGDRGFTLFLRDKSVFWIDRLNNRSLREALPTSAVLDILSGLFYVRNQPLEVGKSLVLPLFDSNRYALTTVAVLRKEHLTLPGPREVDTLLVHPQLKTEGIFKRTGEILVWLTDDQNKVPVKVETRISLGKVTAELVSAQTHGPPPAKAPVRAGLIGPADGLRGGNR